VTEPDLITVDVPAEQVRVGDLLVIDTVDHHVEQVNVDAVPEFVYAFVPEQIPLRRDSLARVRRPPTPAPAPIAPVNPVEFAAVRDLTLALADLQPPTGQAAAGVRAAADRVRKARP